MAFATHRTLEMYSIVTVLVVVPACTSETPPGAATGGATATGGSTSSTNTSVAGGTSSGSAAAGGAPSATGGTVGRDCIASNTPIADADGIIATFSHADAGSESAKSPFEYPFDGTAPVAVVEAGSLHITQNAPPKSTAQYTGVVLGFENCINASAFKGVEFSIRGSFAGCTMKYFTGDVAHQDATTGAPHATGPEGAYQPQTPIPSSRISSTPVTMQMAFDDYVSEGYPSTPLDTAKLILIGWQLEIPAASGANCVADITIDDVRFY